MLQTSTRLKPFGQRYLQMWSFMGLNYSRGRPMETSLDKKVRSSRMERLHAFNPNSCVFQSFRIYLISRDAILYRAIGAKK